MSQIPNTLPSDVESGPTGSAATLGKWALGLIVAGALVTLVAIFRDAERVGFAYLWAFAFAWNLIVGCLFFIALHHATHAVWSVVVRRVAEMFASMMPALIVMVIPVLLFVVADRLFPVYAWSNPEAVHDDHLRHLLEGKAPYLNAPFFIVRGLFYVLVWATFAAVFIRRSLRQDDYHDDQEMTCQLRRWSVAFFPVFALTVTFASFDWLMSLEPWWFSTIYGVYVFSGMTVTGLAAITLAVIWLRAKGRMGADIVRDDHLYNLGALLFTFTCFWAYIAFSQFLLIWYGSIPEETVYFVTRMKPGWKSVTLALAILRFIVPFFLLLSRPAKSSPSRLVFVSLLVLVGQMLDLYWLIMPSLHVDAPRLNWQELGPLALVAGVLMLFIGRFVSKQNMLPVGDPLFEKSRNFHL